MWLHAVISRLCGGCHIIPCASLCGEVRPSPCQASSRKQNHSCCTASFPVITWLTVDLLLDFPPPVLLASHPSSLFILDLLRSLYRKPGGRHLCGTLHFLLTSEPRPDLQPPCPPPWGELGLCPSCSLCLSPSCYLDPPCVLSHSWHWVFSYRTDSFSLIFLDFLNIRQQCVMTQIPCTYFLVLTPRVPTVNVYRQLEI